MNKIEAVKFVGGLIVSAGVGAITNNAIRATTPQTLGLINKVCIGVGSIVLSGIVCDKATKYANEQIDHVVDAFNGTHVEIKVEEN